MDIYSNILITNGLIVSLLAALAILLGVHLSYPRGGATPDDENAQLEPSAAHPAIQNLDLTPNQMEELVARGEEAEQQDKSGQFDAASDTNRPSISTFVSQGVLS